MPPPAGARKGLPYNADALPLRTTRMGLYEEMVICSGPRTPALKGRPEQGSPGASTQRANPMPVTAASVSVAVLARASFD